MINIKSDSRKVKPGDTFIALPGIDGDGHDYIESAIKNGATKIIAEHGNYSVETVIVPSTREYLYNYLETNYNKYLDEMTIIGITGTNGKTTSCYLIYQMLNMLGKKCAYIGTIGYYLDKKICSLANTCPDTCDLYDYIINAYDLGYRYVALEASSVGLLYKRINNMPFDYAIFTNLTHSHGESHPTMEDYALAKQLLFKKLKPTGKAIVNIDDKYAPYYLLNGNHNITYGFNKSDYQMSDYQVNDFNTYFNYMHDGQIYNIHSKLIGKYNVYNLMVAIIVLKEMGIDENTIANTILQITEPPGRMELIPYGTNLIIIDYAHTPDGVEKAVSAVKEVTRGNLYTIFSCRGMRDRTMRPLITKNALVGSYMGIITTDSCQDEDPKQIIADMLNGLVEHNYELILNRKAAVRRGIDLLKNNDVLLILGRGHQEVMYVKDQVIPYSDRKVALEYLEEIKNKVTP